MTTIRQFNENQQHSFYHHILLSSFSSQSSSVTSSVLYFPFLTRAVYCSWLITRSSDSLFTGVSLRQPLSVEHHLFCPFFSLPLLFMAFFHSSRYNVQFLLFGSPEGQHEVKNAKNSRNRLNGCQCHTFLHAVLGVTEQQDCSFSFSFLWSAANSIIKFCTAIFHISFIKI